MRNDMGSTATTNDMAQSCFNAYCKASLKHGANGNTTATDPYADLAQTEPWARHEECRGEAREGARPLRGAASAEAASGAPPPSSTRSLAGALA